MLTVININRMAPPIAPIGLDYVAGATRRSGVEVELLDLGMAARPDAEMSRYFADRRPDLVGVSLRNVDDCFWPGAQWFVPELQEIITRLRMLTDAPVVLGGVGYSIFAERIIELTGAEFGIRGDGEQSVVALLSELVGSRRFDRVPGLVWQTDDGIRANAPAWPETLSVPTERDTVDNAAYFRLGGQIGLETKRGCPRRCAYCADPVAKGATIRLRSPADVADEVQSLLAQGVDMLHLCDAEFNLPPRHASDVCDELIRRRLGRRVRWYAYLAVTPFDAALAGRMARAGCAGINFTSDASSPTMLSVYRQPHRKEDLARAVRLCRDHGIAVMLDMLLGGPGETPETVAETIGDFKRIDPDCAGAALGVRLYPGTAMPGLVAAEGPLESHPGVRRHYGGSIDLVRPTFYISPSLGEHPARLVRDLIGGDPRFFAPEDDAPQADALARSDHNYNDNRALVDAIRDGARGAYWDILRQLRA
jgi:radical SAM superfamily enzyme YgiQ (UPF0313 family)